MAYMDPMGHRKLKKKLLKGTNPMVFPVHVPHANLF